MDTKIKRISVGIIILAVFYIPLILFSIYPLKPLEITGWLIIILIGMPILLALEFIGESIFNKKVGMKISEKRFSTFRVIIALLIFLTFGIMFYVLMWHFESLIRVHFG